MAGGCVQPFSFEIGGVGWDDLGAKYSWLWLWETDVGMVVMMMMMMDKRENKESREWSLSICVLWFTLTDIGVF